MTRSLVLFSTLLLLLGGVFSPSTSVHASPSPTITATPTFDVTRLAQPPTVVPPHQADNGAQVYWGTCSACHGDRGQGLTLEWRDAYDPDHRDCWQSGCHGNDFAKNSFEIPQTGVPALAGPGKLTRFSNTYDLQSFIHANMPFFPSGSLTSEGTLSLAAYILKLNDTLPAGLALNEVNSAAIPIHRKVKLPESRFPGTLLLAGVLALAASGLALQAGRKLVKTTYPAARPNFFHHLHPPSIPAEQSRFRYTMGTGGLAVLLILILFITGLLEMYYYIPTPEKAAVSVATLTTLVPFGSLVRNLHFWSAQCLVIVVTIHLLRVTLTGAYAQPRRFNYLLGLGLLVLVLLLDFTGYVLRWDEGIRWALVVGTNLLKTVPGIGNRVYQFVIGGDEPGAGTLTRFYAWHIFGLALAAGILFVWHIFRVRRDGGIAVPPPDRRPERARITRFELLRRETLAILVAIVVLLLFSLIIPAPIEPPISNANAMTGDSRAPWFFLWVQQLLRLGDPFVWGVLTPVLVVIGLGLLPYALPNAKKEELGRWFPAGNRIAQVLAVLVISIILVLTVWGAF